MNKPANAEKQERVAQGADILASIDFSDLSDVADSASAYELQDSNVLQLELA